jgi:hypothetical protein
MLLMAVLPPLLLAGYGLRESYLYTQRTIQSGHIPWLTILGFSFVCLAGWWVLFPPDLALQLPSNRGAYSITASPFPTRAPTRTPTLQPTLKPTLQVPVMDAAFVLAIVEQAQGSCQDLPLAFWKQPGKYTYKLSDSSGREALYTLDYPSAAALPADLHCQALPWGFAGDLLSDPPTAGYATAGWVACNYAAGAPYGSTSITIAGLEPIVTPWGALDALRLDTARSYHVATINDPHGTLTTSEWHVCGLGLVRADQQQEEWYQYHAKQTTARLELVWVELSP